MREITEELVIVNELGLHARSAAVLVQTALQFKSEVYLHVNGQHANAKSIMGLLMLAAGRGTRIMVTCLGEDAHEAMEAIRRLIESGFGET